MESLLSDDLLRQLIAAGQVDVVVGVPTLNNAATVGGVVRAVHLAFTGPFKRDRTVLINFDAGSDDGTPDIVRRASLVESDTLVAPPAFRTIHRISSPYHGLPGKGGALRALFAAAELLDAKAVALFDPDVVSITSDWVARLVRPVYRDGYDYVAPVFTRHPAEGPLVTQLARPLVRGAYGHRMRPRAPLPRPHRC
jgi:glycosyltransferase involved in cell wall biosynthesis